MPLYKGYVETKGKASIEKLKTEPSGKPMMKLKT